MMKKDADDMDYEKKYKDALERARSMYESKDDAELASFIFPELRESEDERTRKWLYGYFSKIGGKNWIYPGITCEEVLAWLEKQKEKSLFEEAMEKMAAISRQVLDEYEIEEQKEQKPVEWNDEYREEDLQTRFAFYTYKDDSSVLYLSNVFVEEASRNHGFGTRILKAAEKAAEAIGATTISLKVKQDSPANAWYRKRGYGYVAFEDGYDWLEKNLEYMKPNKPVEWSEEETKHLVHILKVLDDCYIYGRHDLSKTDYDNLTSTLKSLPERYSIQPKQERSEEDEKFFRLLHAGLYAMKVNIGKDDYDKAVERLKSLRPSWKPSEEQMAWLKLAIDEAKAPLKSQLEELYKNIRENLIWK